MNAVLAIIADGGRAIIVIDREAIQIIFFSCILLILLIPFYNGLVQPLAKRLQRVRLVHQNHAAGGGNGSIMVGMFVYLCLASQKPSEQEFFVPVIGHGIGGKYIPIMAHLAKARHWSKR